MFPISSCQVSLCKMYSIGIVSDCMSRKIIRSTPDRNNLFGRKMKSSLNYLFIRLTDVIVRNKHRELQLLLKLENGDVRCNQYIAWLLEIYQSSFLKKKFVLYFTKMLLLEIDPSLAGSRPRFQNAASSLPLPHLVNLAEFPSFLSFLMLSATKTTIII